MWIYQIILAENGWVATGLSPLLPLKGWSPFLRPVVTGMLSSPPARSRGNRGDFFRAPLPAPRRESEAAMSLARLAFGRPLLVTVIFCLPGNAGRPAEPASKW